MPDNAADEQQALATEFDVLARRAGLDIPEDRKEAMLKGFKDLKRLTALLRQHLFDPDCDEERLT
jgi:hypothetical protein